MNLDRNQLGRVHDVLLRSFDRDELRIMLRLQLGEDLDTVAGDDDLRTVVFNLVTWADRTDRIGELIAGALASNPTNPELQALAADYRHWQQAPPPPAPGTSPPLTPAAPPDPAPSQGAAPAPPGPAAQSQRPVVSAPPPETPLVVEKQGRSMTWALGAAAAVALVVLGLLMLRPFLFPPTPIDPAPVNPTPGQPTLPAQDSPLAPSQTATPTVTPTLLPTGLPTDLPTATGAPTTQSTPTLMPTLISTSVPTLTPLPAATATADQAPTATATPLQPPRAPALSPSRQYTTFTEDSRLLTVRSGKSIPLDMRDLWSAPQGTPPTCADAFVLVSWQVRQPYPGGQDLEIRRVIPRGGGQTEPLADGPRGRADLSYCDSIILKNLDIVDYRLEWRFVSAIENP